MARVLTNTLNAVAKDIRVDFNTTTQTWQHDVAFTIESPSPYERIIGTGDSIYGMLNEGTPEHDIRPRNKSILVFHTPFRSKTLPRSISSGPGSKGSTRVISRHGVRHPGTTAREWDTTIAEKWDRKVGPIFQRAIDSEVR